MDVLIKNTTIEEIAHHPTEFWTSIAMHKTVLVIKDVYGLNINVCELEEVEPIKHGQWIKRGDNSWECSECHEISCCKGNYCVDCGARMVEE